MMPMWSRGGERLTHTCRDESVPSEGTENHLLRSADANFLPLLLAACLRQQSQRWIVRRGQLAHVWLRGWPEVVGAQIALPGRTDDPLDGVAEEMSQARDIEARCRGQAG